MGLVDGRLRLPANGRGRTRLGASGCCLQSRAVGGRRRRDDADRLAGLPLGLWCGTEDSYYPAVMAFEAALPQPPDIASYSEGGHTRYYWNDHTLDAFEFLAARLR